MVVRRNNIVRFVSVVWNKDYSALFAVSWVVVITSFSLLVGWSREVSASFGGSIWLTFDKIGFAQRRGRKRHLRDCTCSNIRSSKLGFL